MTNTRLRIGYIPLLDAVALNVMVDGDFATAEGLAEELVREVSWSNVRDKLNKGASRPDPVQVAWTSKRAGRPRLSLVR